MNITLPGSPIYDIASSTQAVLDGVMPAIILAGGVYLGLFIVSFVIQAVAQKYYPQEPPMDEHTPMM